MIDKVLELLAASGAFVIVCCVILMTAQRVQTTYVLEDGEKFVSPIYWPAAADWRR